jgi:hypothetical protein
MAYARQGPFTFLNYMILESLTSFFLGRTI